MAVRTTMNRMIAQVGKLLGEATADAFDVQTALDRHRRLIRYFPLTTVPTYLPGSGTVQYKEFWSEGLTEWEDGAELVDSRYTPVTPTTVDLQNGVWTFAEHQKQEIFISGAVYDLYGAAADLLAEIAATLKRKADVQDKDAMLKRSQMIQQCLELAAVYREKQKPVSMKMRRSDV